MKDVRPVAFQTHHSVTVLNLFDANCAVVVTKYRVRLLLKFEESFTVNVGRYLLTPKRIVPVDAIRSLDVNEQVNVDDDIDQERKEVNERNDHEKVVKQGRDS